MAVICSYVSITAICSESPTRTRPTKIFRRFIQLVDGRSITRAKALRLLHVYRIVHRPRDLNVMLSRIDSGHRCAAIAIRSARYCPVTRDVGCMWIKKGVAATHGSFSAENPLHARRVSAALAGQGANNGRRQSARCNFPSGICEINNL